MEWTFELTRDAVPALVQRYTWALQRQNQRIVQRLPQGRLSLERRRALAALISLVGLAGTAALYAIDRQPTYLAGAAVFGAGLVASLFMARIRAWSKRTAGAMLERQAEQTYARLAPSLPSTMTYALDDDTLRDVALVLHAPGALFAFRGLHATRAHRFFYLPEARQAEALAIFERRGIACEALTGPVEQYDDAIPTARVRV